jgi:hypothetical protein
MNSQNFKWYKIIDVDWRNRKKSDDKTKRQEQQDRLEMRYSAYKKRAAFPEKSDPFAFWRPQTDLNRRRRRERAVSWAGLDDGDLKGLALSG